MASSPKFRKDNAMAFLKRSNARPVSLLHDLLNKGTNNSSGGGGGVSSGVANGGMNPPPPPSASSLLNRLPQFGGGGGGGIGGATAATSSSGPAIGGGGLGVGKALLLRAHTDSPNAQHAMKSYLHTLVARHIATSSSSAVAASPSGVGGAPSSSGAAASASGCFLTAVRSVVKFLIAKKKAHSDAAGGGPSSHFANPFQSTIVKWIVAPGNVPFDLALMLSTVEATVRDLLEESLPRQQGGQQQHSYSSLFGALEATLHQYISRLYMSTPLELLPLPAAVIGELVLLVIERVEVSHPTDAGEFIHAIATCRVSAAATAATPAGAGGIIGGGGSAIPINNAQSKFPFLRVGGGAANTATAGQQGPPAPTPPESSTTPLIIIDGLGYKEAYLSCLERHLSLGMAACCSSSATASGGGNGASSLSSQMSTSGGVGGGGGPHSLEIPLRWALETLTQSQHAAFIITETFRGNGGTHPPSSSSTTGWGGGGGGGSSGGYGFSAPPPPPSHPSDLRRDSYFVQNLTSRASQSVPSVVAAGMMARYGGGGVGAAATSSSLSSAASPMAATANGANATTLGNIETLSVVASPSVATFGEVLLARQEAQLRRLLNSGDGGPNGSGFPHTVVKLEPGVGAVAVDSTASATSNERQLQQRGTGTAVGRQRVPAGAASGGGGGGRFTASSSSSANAAAAIAAEQQRQLQLATDKMSVLLTGASVDALKDVLRALNALPPSETVAVEQRGGGGGGGMDGDGDDASDDVLLTEPPSAADPSTLSSYYTTVSSFISSLQFALTFTVAHNTGVSVMGVGSSSSATATNAVVTFSSVSRGDLLAAAASSSTTGGGPSNSLAAFGGSSSSSSFSSAATLSVVAAPKLSVPMVFTKGVGGSVSFA